jgi:GxxExxY protein
MTNYFDSVAQMKDPRTYAVIGASMEVHRELGRGFLEAVYREALAKEFLRRGIPFRSEVELVIRYKQEALQCTYRADFICYDDVLVEIKALAQITGVERAQVINYLKATGLRVAVLINFGAESLQYERVVFG